MKHFIVYKIGIIGNKDIVAIRHSREDAEQYINQQAKEEVYEIKEV